MSKKLNGQNLVDMVLDMPDMAVPMVQLPRRWKVVTDGETQHVVLNDLNLANMLADVGTVKHLSSEKSLPLLQDVKVSVKNGNVVGVQERRLTLVGLGMGDFSFTNVPKDQWEESLEEMETVAEMDLKFLTRFNEVFGDMMTVSLESRVADVEDRLADLESAVATLEAGDSCDSSCSGCDEDSEDLEEDLEEDSEEDSEDDDNW